jgi:hypothetical protein
MERKIQDIVDALKGAVETGNIVNVLTMLENVAKENGVYVKLRAEDVLMLYYDQLPYSTGYQVVIVLRGGVAITYDLFKDGKVQIGVRRL